jgi:hypothetical protein
MTAGIGHCGLKRFYIYNCVNAKPRDMALVPITRTAGAGLIPRSTSIVRSYPHLGPDRMFLE